MSSTERSEASNGKTSEEVHRQGLLPAMEFLAAHKSDALMWISRIATMIFTFLYLFPLFTASQYSYYYKALIASGITSILRLHQRIPKVEFTKEFLSRLLQEDSCHYVLFTLIYLYTYPTTLVLLPVFLFAFLHSTSFTLKLLQALGFSWSWYTDKLSKVVVDHGKGILRLVAFTEIFLMPFSVFMLFIGRGSLLTPIIYYRFLTLRYQSKRNPYTRAVFCELRLSVEILASQPAVPERLRQLCHKLIQLVSRLAPPIATA